MNLSKFQIEINNDLVWRLIMALAAISIILVMSDVALATGTNNDIVGTTLCKLVANLQGGTAKAIATIAIFSVGVGLFLGKVNWSVAAMTAVGVGVIFGAEKLVSFISSDAGSDCPTE